MEYSFDQLLHKAASYCSIAEHCTTEVDEKLQKWGASEVERNSIIDSLIEKDFINENRYAAAFVRDKFRFNKWGKMKISYALKMKRIAGAAVSEALSQIDDDEYQALLVDVLKSKLKSLKYGDEYERNGKLIRYAQSKGFEYEQIDCALRQLASVD